MITLVRTISTAVAKGLRSVKLLGLGKADVQTAHQSTPYGVDSNPVKGMVAVYAPSGIKGQPVILGYINKQNLAAPGENRTFSTNEAGELQFYIWQKADGTCEVGGATDWMVRYSKLEEAFNELKQDFNTFVNLYNNHVHPVNNAVPAAPGPVVATAPTASGTTSNADITPAKIEQIKTI